MMARNPVLAEDLRSFFTHPPLLRSLLALVAGPILLLAAWWPRGTLASSLLASSPPPAFEAVAVGLLAIATYLNFRYGTEDWAPPRTTCLRDLAALTPVSIPAALAGRTGSGALHVLLQALLAAPVLIACRAVSGAAPPAAAEALAVLASWAMACRAFGTTGRALLPTQGMLRGTIALLLGAGFFLGTFLVAPAVNPVSAIIAIDDQAPGRPSLPVYGPAVLAGLAVAVACTLGAWGVLRRVRITTRAAEGQSGASSR